MPEEPFVEAELNTTESVRHRAAGELPSDADNTADDTDAVHPLIAKIAYGHALLVDLYSEFETFCDRMADGQCSGCAGERDDEKHSCEDDLSRLLSRFLDTAATHVRNEHELIGLHRVDPLYTHALKEHVLSHDLLINDLSAYVMDCGKVPTEEVVASVLWILKYWIECHMATHDRTLFEIATGTTTAS